MILPLSRNQKSAPNQQIFSDLVEKTRLNKMSRDGEGG